MLQRNERGHETYDYLPVEDEGKITGLFRTRTIAADPPEGETVVQSIMDGLSSASLIGGDGAILDFLLEVDEKPYVSWLREIGSPDSLRGPTFRSFLSERCSSA
ncbi:hypothetical protein [Candidatus Palauibacter sp.]|uniref:hypothetical protein n=1 Tax=Candidatus Palauibacter sp. TaxID=3101350 RepID=UPI003C6EE2EA